MDEKRSPRIMMLTGGERFAGIEAHLNNLIPTLVDMGADVRLATFSEGPLARRMEAIGIPRFIVRRSWKYDPACVGRLAALLKEEGIGLVHTHGYLADVIGLTAAGRVPGVAGVATLHGLSEPFGWMDALKMRANLLLDRRMVKTRAKAVMAVSHEVAEWLTSSWGVPRERVHVVHNGVRIPVQEPGVRQRMREELDIRREVTAVCFICRLERIKRPLLFVEIAARVLERKSDAVIVVVGKGPLLDSTRSAAHAAGHGGRFRFLGFRDDVDRVLAAMDVIVNTSEHEGIPLSLLEAMGQGVVPVAFDVGGLPEVIESGRNGILVPFDDKARFAEELSLLIEDPDRLKAYGKDASETVRERFTDRIMAKAVFDIYRLLAG